MFHGILGSDALCIVVPQHFVKQVKRCPRCQVIIFFCHKVAPGLALYVSYFPENYLIFIFYIIPESEFFQVGIQILSAEYLYSQLKFFVTLHSFACKEVMLSLEHQLSKDEAHCPDVYCVVINMFTKAILRGKEHYGFSPSVVLVILTVEFTQAPIEDG